MGCKVKLEKAGECLGIQILQPNGKSDLFSVNFDDLKEIIKMMNEVAQ